MTKPQWLFHISCVIRVEIALVGEDAQPFLDVAFGAYRLNQAVTWKQDGEAATIQLLEGREAREGEARAYVCQNFACLMP